MTTPTPAPDINRMPSSRWRHVMNAGDVAMFVIFAFAGVAFAVRAMGVFNLFLGLAVADLAVMVGALVMEYRADFANDQDPA